MNVDRAAEIGTTVDPAALGAMPVVTEDAPLEARWIVAELHATAAKVNQSLENYRYDDAANAIYQFFWGSFCDWYLEIVKLRLDFPMNGPNSESANQQASKSAGRKAALTTLVSVFEASLRLLSPFMPFLTEEIWHALYDGNPPAKSVALTTYPQVEGQYLDLRENQNFYTINNCSRGAALEMRVLQSIVTALRAHRKERGVPERETVLAAVYCAEEDGSLTLGCVTNESFKRLCESLAKVKLSVKPGKPPTGVTTRSEVGFTVAVTYEATIDVHAERDRLTKDIAKYEKGVAAAERQLSNESFLAKAPANVVEGLKKQEAETCLLLEKARAALENLNKGK
jgi:valyl-tRNA synthetase